MKNIRNLAIAVIVVGLVSLLFCVIAKLTIVGAFVGFSPRTYGSFTVICFLLSINMLLLDKKA
jgi:hypothetical protein